MSPEFFTQLSDCVEGDRVQLKGTVRHSHDSNLWYIIFDGNAGALFPEDSAKVQVVIVLTGSPSSE